MSSPGTLIPFEAAHLPLVQPWFEDDEVQRSLGGPGWPEMVLRLAADFQPGEEFRGQIVLLKRSFVLLDDDGQPVALVTGDLYDRLTEYAGEGPDGPAFVDEPGLTGVRSHLRSWSIPNDGARVGDSGRLTHSWPILIWHPPTSFWPASSRTISPAAACSNDLATLWNPTFPIGKTCSITGRP